MKLVIHFLNGQVEIRTDVERIVEKPSDFKSTFNISNSCGDLYIERDVQKIEVYP